MTEKVTCPICNKLFVEINLPHLKRHGLTIQEYDALYPNNPRMTTARKASKARYAGGVDPITSLKLKKSHTLDGYIEKYGLIEGTQRYDQMKANKSNSKSLENFVDKYGDELGPIKHYQYQESRKRLMTKEGFIERYGDLGIEKFRMWQENNKRSNTEEYYIEKYGAEEGKRKWELKNYRNSQSSIRTQDRKDFALYKLVVTRLTRRTLAKSFIPNNHLIKKGEYSLDHKVSIMEGFKNSVPPFIIACTHNLEVVPHKYNSSKQERCSISVEHLCDLFYTR